MKHSINKKHHIEYFGKKVCKRQVCFCFSCVLQFFKDNKLSHSLFLPSTEYKTPVLLSSLSRTVTKKTAMWAAAQHLLLEESVINILIHCTLVIHSGIIIETQTLLLTYCWKVDGLNTGKETCDVRLTRFSRALVLLQTALKHWKLTSTVASDLPDHRTALRWKKNII